MILESYDPSSSTTPTPCRPQERSVSAPCCSVLPAERSWIFLAMTRTRSSATSAEGRNPRAVSVQPKTRLPRRPKHNGV